MADGRYIAEKDYADFVRLMDEFRAVGRTLRKPIRGKEGRPGRGGGRPVIGKPASTFAEGVLTAPNNVVNIWLGPAHGGSSAATGATIEADYSTGAFGTSDFVTVTTAKDGKKYVTCFPSGS